jgi:hypothetical protein
MRRRLIAIAATALLVAGCRDVRKPTFRDPHEGFVTNGLAVGNCQGWEAKLSTSPYLLAGKHPNAVELTLRPPEGERIRGRVELRFRSATPAERPYEESISIHPDSFIEHSRNNYTVYISDFLRPPLGAHVIRVTVQVND